MKYFKLDQSTSQRQHVDDTNEGSLTHPLSSEVCMYRFQI